MTFEIDGTGTRISITHSGFGDGEDWAMSLESISRGADESIADLILYLETGVGYARHPMERTFHGIQAREVPAGLRVHSVVPSTFGAELGLQQGDLVVEVDGAPVFGYRELWTIARSREPGTSVTASWIREGALHHGTATLDRRPIANAVTT
jgi:S1-C subfamily serine protease